MKRVNIPFFLSFRETSLERIVCERIILITIINLVREHVLESCGSLDEMERQAFAYTIMKFLVS
jgi:hypothetical protein